VRILGIALAAIPLQAAANQGYNSPRTHICATKRELSEFGAVFTAWYNLNGLSRFTGSR